MNALAHKLLRESAVMLRNLAKRLDAEESDQSTGLQSQPPLEPWEKQGAVERLARKSPLLFRENRKAIEKVFAQRGVSEKDTIDSVLKESRRQ